MELDWLETFLAVVDHGGFTAASEQVHRSQSRVSAHIAGLERELGVRLIDRTRRPARLTAAGEVFARHAREVVAGIGSARSAVGALRAMEDELLGVLTTPCIGSAVFPDVLARVAERYPGVRLALSEQCWHDVVRRFSEDGIVVAVLPRLRRPLPPGLRERMLWREPIQLSVTEGHPLTGLRGAVPPDRLVTQPLVMAGATSDTDPELVSLLARRGLAVQPRVTVDSPTTVIEMVRGGVGVGVLNGVAVAGADVSGLTVLDIADPTIEREVAAYWYEVLVTTEVGTLLHRTVLEMPMPAGAHPVSPRRAELSAAGAAETRPPDLRPADR